MSSAYGDQARYSGQHPQQPQSGQHPQQPQSGQHPQYPPPYGQYATAPPPAAYYYPPQQTHYDSGGDSCIACLVCFMMLFMFGFLIFALVGGGNTPEFTIRSLSVSSFKVTNDALSAMWDANIQVAKRRFIFRPDVYIDRIEGVIYSSKDDISLANSQYTHFDMGLRNDFNLKLATMGTQGGKYNTLVEERSKGVVTFSLKMVARISTRSSWFWARTSKYRIICEKLDVRFADQSGSGNLVDGNRGCNVRGHRWFSFSDDF